MGTLLMRVRVISHRNRICLRTRSLDLCQVITTTFFDGWDCGLARRLAEIVHSMLVDHRNETVRQFAARRRRHTRPHFRFAAFERRPGLIPLGDYRNSRPADAEDRILISDASLAAGHV